MNGCGDATQPFDPSPCVQYTGCARPVVWCEVPDVGHTISPAGGARATWAFFSR